MLYNNIIKRGVKDTTWLYSFIESSLNGKAGVTRPCTDKMLYALKKYGRWLKYQGIHVGSEVEGLFYYDGKYAFCVTSYIKGHLLNIYDVRKCIDLQIDRAIKTFIENVDKCKRNNLCCNNKQWVELNKKYRKLELENTYNIFNFVLIDAKLINTDKSQDKILEEIYKLEDEIYIKQSLN